VIRAVAVIALATAAAVSAALWWLIVNCVGWFALLPACAGLAGLVALANLVNYGHALPPENAPPPWWR